MGVTIEEVSVDPAESSSTPAHPGMTVSFVDSESESELESSSEGEEDDEEDGDDDGEGDFEGNAGDEGFVFSHPDQWLDYAATFMAAQQAAAGTKSHRSFWWR